MPIYFNIVRIFVEIIFVKVDKITQEYVFVYLFWC